MLTDEKKISAMNMQHNLMFFDQILEIKDKGEQVQASIAWEMPNGSITQPVTMIMTRSFAKELAKKLSEASK
jgi:hypothetical protein